MPVEAGWVVGSGGWKSGLGGNERVGQEGRLSLADKWLGGGA